MKYSANFERDYIFYFLNKRKFTFCGEEVLAFPHNSSGVSAKKAFHVFDSTGKILATRHPRLATTLLQCKKAINFQIKQWVEGYDDCLIGTKEYLNEFIGILPEWVETAFRNQRSKKYFNHKLRNICTK